jgi:hypothetical protein
MQGFALVGHDEEMVNFYKSYRVHSSSNSDHLQVSCSSNLNLSQFKFIINMPTSVLGISLLTALTGETILINVIRLSQSQSILSYSFLTFSDKRHFEANGMRKGV